MKKATIFASCVALIIFGAIVTAQAATISLTPLTQDVNLGNQAVLKLSMDFTGDSTIGGGIDIFYDSSVLSFSSFVFDPIFTASDDPTFRRAGDDMPGEVNGIAFGNFGGLSGPSLVGTLTFDTLAIGSAFLSMADNDTPAGGFFSITASPQTVIFEGASVNVVPVPGAFWLLGSGLIGFAGFRKKSKE